MIPNDLIVEITQPDGSPQVLYLDTNYNSTFALLHEDYRDDAIPVDLGLTFLQVYALSPVDLAVSKIARLADNDREDLCSLVKLGLVTPEEIEQRANEAMVSYVGGLSMLQLNVKDAVALAQQAAHQMAD